MVSLRIAILAGLLVAAPAPRAESASGSGGSAGRVQWIAPDGTVAWAAPLGDASGEAAEVLLATAWYPRLPGIDLEYLEGEGPAVRAGGKILILDFWATWCEPCARELGELQALREKEAAAGLEVVAVNMQEPDDTVRQFAWSLGLQMPIARYTAPMHRALGVDTLPTAILVDRRGQIRARWNGYREGLIEEIAARVRELLAEGEPPGDPLAGVVVGAGTLRVDWSRLMEGPAEGLAFLSTRDAAPGIAVATGRDLVFYEAGGRIVDRRGSPRSLGRLRAADLDGEPGFEVISFRPGGRTIVTSGAAADALDAWEAPAPVLDTALIPSSGDGKAGALIVATSGGVHRLAPDGTPVAGREDLGRATGIAALTPDGSALAVLGEEGRLLWLDGALSASGGPIPVEAGSRLLASGLDPAGVGLFPGDVRAAAVGRLLGDRGSQVALAQEGTLTILDARTGALLFRASWPDISHLAAGDLDRRPGDELIVAARRRLTVLGVPPQQ
jgi:thiol-disulfide isomerase/thioredoxin